MIAASKPDFSQSKSAEIPLMSDREIDDLRDAISEYLGESVAPNGTLSLCHMNPGHSNPKTFYVNGYGFGCRSPRCVGKTGRTLLSFVIQKEFDGDFSRSNIAEAYRMMRNRGIEYESKGGGHFIKNDRELPAGYDEYIESERLRLARSDIYYDLPSYQGGMPLDDMLWLAANRNYYFMPIRDKIPFLKGDYESNAYNDPDKIIYWHRRGCGHAILPGMGGFIALDIEYRNTAAGRFEKINDDFGASPVTLRDGDFIIRRSHNLWQMPLIRQMAIDSGVIAGSASGGWHIYFADPEQKYGHKWLNRYAGLFQYGLNWIEVRARKKYVVAYKCDGFKRPLKPIPHYVKDVYDLNFDINRRAKKETPAWPRGHVFEGK